MESLRDTVSASGVYNFNRTTNPSSVSSVSTLIPVLNTLSPWSTLNCEN